MSELGPNGRWVVVRDIKADPGGSMAIIEDDVYRSPCMSHNPGVPTYTRREISIIKKDEKSAELFRSVQAIKRVFPTARVKGVSNES